MASFQGQSIGIVLLGRHNPQILNHDFLLKHKVLPVDQEPFASLLKQQEGQAFTEFICTPVISSLRYGPVNIVVEDGRFQIGDQRFDQINNAQLTTRKSSASSAVISSTYFDTRPSRLAGST
jgi:hypothetical protein